MYVRLSLAVRRRMEALQEPRIDVEDVRAVVDGHLELAIEAAAAGKPVDIELARRMHRACLDLLESPGLSDADYRLVQSACLYFADDEDVDGDFDSSIGLQDDVEVLNYVAASVGRPDLTIT